MNEQGDPIKTAKRLAFEYRSLAMIYFFGGIAMLIIGSTYTSVKILVIPGMIAFVVGALALIFIARIAGWLKSLPKNQ